MSTASVLLWSCRSADDCSAMLLGLVNEEAAPRSDCLLSEADTRLQALLSILGFIDAAPGSSQLLSLSFFFLRHTKILGMLAGVFEQLFQVMSCDEKGMHMECLRRRTVDTYCVIHNKTALSISTFILREVLHDFCG